MHYFGIFLPNPLMQTEGGGPCTCSCKSCTCPSGEVASRAAQAAAFASGEAAGQAVDPQQQ